MMLYGTWFDKKTFSSDNSITLIILLDTHVVSEIIQIQRGFKLNWNSGTKLNQMLEGLENGFSDRL